MAVAEPVERTQHRVENTALTQLRVTGMTCGNCARHVTEAIQNVPGVRTATVDLDQQQARVRWVPGTEPRVPEVLHAIEDAGFSARAVEGCGCGHEEDEHESHGWHLNLWVGALGTVPLMLGEWVFGLGSVAWYRWASFGIAAIVQVIGGGPFYRGAWRQAKSGNSNMDTLVALGSTTAFIYSAWTLFSGSTAHLYFMEAAAIITLVSVGHWIESRVAVRASTALRQLLQLAPERARRRNIDDSESDVPVAELKRDEVVVLRPGDRVPTDGQITEGDSAVDEAMLTGESVPVDKKPGAEVYAGTVNLTGHMLMRVTATGEETALAHVIAAVQRAQSSRANIQRLGDRVSSVFVPIVVLVALAAGLWWGFAPGSAHVVHDWFGRFMWFSHAPEGQMAAGFIIAASVLIVACPCAMGLATPAAIMAGSNAAAARGILIRDGIALEKAGRVTAVLFDKTGTLTSGRPKLMEVWQARSANEATSAVQLAAAIARRSSHPISQAIATGNCAVDGDSEVAEFLSWREISGSGIEAALSGNPHGQTLRFGSVNWLKQNSVELQGAQEFINTQAAAGSTVTGLAVGSKLLAAFAVRDTLKPGAREVVDQLRSEGLDVHLITGDNAITAAAIAKEAGIRQENVFAEIRPEQKAEMVRQLQQRGKRIAFIGDGINDAPALEQADLGIAVSRASDIAREAADIILLKSEIQAVPESLGLARATLRTIKQNLFWAFFYNIIGIPLAALGFMSPVICAAAMGFSDIIVIGNALRLRKWKR